MPLILVGAATGDSGELSHRAADALAAADIVYGENTERVAAADVLARLDRGERVAVVLAAGGPRRSGSVERLVRAAVEAGLPVEVVPGPSAAVAALVISGLATDRFVVEGALPSGGVARTERLAALAAERRTAVVSEVGDRLARTLAELAGVCGGDRQVAVVRQLATPGEEVWRGPLAGAPAWAADRWSSADGQPLGSGGRPAGAVVLVLEGAPAPAPPDDAELVSALRDQLAAGISPRDAAATVAARFHVPRRRAYQLAVGTARPASFPPDE